MTDPIPSPPAVAIDGLTRVFGDLTAVDHVSLSIGVGEIFGLIGPNGAGKSTLIRMLATLLPPTSGTASIAGHDIVEEPAQVRRHIGYVPQLLSADGSLTGYENHGGRTVLGPSANPLATVGYGVGNGDAAVDGAIQGNVVATYLHGPALARNPALADHLLSRVIGSLDPIDDTEAEALREERFRAVRLAQRVRRKQWRPPARTAE